MRTLYLFLFISFFQFQYLKAQEYYQYFDGNDTSSWNSIFISINEDSSNIWQIGEPQKSIFDMASTQPNAILTDTINHYPTNNESSFSFGIDSELYYWSGIIAIQWAQKLEMDSAMDGGIIEFTNDSGQTWQNIFNNPYVYNLYGYNDENQVELPSGDMAFSGTDSLWKDIWLCFDISWLSLSDSLSIRYTFKSDSIADQKDGWMIDNLMVHPTWVHTVEENVQENYLDIGPNPTNAIVNIQAKKSSEFHIIEELEVIDNSGRIVESYKNVPTRFWIDLSDHPDGVYILRIKTNIKTETRKIVLQKD